MKHKRNHIVQIGMTDYIDFNQTAWWWNIISCLKEKIKFVYTISYN